MSWRLAKTRRRRPTPAMRAGVRGLAAAGMVAAVVVPLARKRLRIPAPVTVAAMVAGPVGLAILKPRTKARDAGLFALQMWAFTVAHELPYDDPERLRERLHVDYPVAIDRVLGGGELPNVRLQRALGRPGQVTRLDKALAMAHWAWFFEPHVSLVWILVRRNDSFARAARQMSAAYDLGCLLYFLVPTAPPWWAAENGRTDAPVRRSMIEVGEGIWGRAWPTLYNTLGGNPWAAMPSLHFATSVLAAILLTESAPGAGAVGWGYAMTLGLALVYLGEHYAVDLLAGAALVAVVRRGEPLAEPTALRVSAAIQRLERIANG